MRKAIVSLLLFFAAGPASAQTCPEFFRFVDFGQKDSSGVIYKGGPTLRAESLSGQPLLLLERTECTNVRDLAVDGRGNPIPVVKSVTYDPAKADVAVRELRVAIADDTKAIADQNAALHLTALQEVGSQVTRGQDFLCVSSEELSGLSCQLESPYPGGVPLVVYCDDVDCKMPVLAIDRRIFVSAARPHSGTTGPKPADIGAVISDVIQQIHSFLDPLSAAF